MKLLFFFPVAVLLLTTILIFNNKVWSDSDEVARKIIFGDETWNMVTNPEFKLEWFTNKDTVTITVDLQEDFTKWKAMNKDEVLPTERPFEVTAKMGETAVVPISIKEKLNTNAEFDGSYLVEIPVNKDGKLDITTSIKDGNSWGLSPSEGNFHITRDTEAPVIKLSGVAEGALSKNDITLNMAVTEKYFIDKNVTVLVKDLNSNEQSEISPVWKQNDQSGAWEASHLFSNSGEFEVSINAKDKAGNVGTEKRVSFAINKKSPELSVTDIEHSLKIADTGYSRSKKVQFKVNSGISIATATASISKIGEHGEPTSAVLKINEQNTKEAFLDYEFTQDGKYVIDATVTDKNKNGESHKLPPFTFEIDSTPPALSVTDGAGNPAQGEYSSKQNIIISIFDTNFNKEKASISGTRKGMDGKEVSLNNLLVLDEAGNASLAAEADGIYELTLKATDQAGNESTKNVSFTIDVTAPKVTHNIDQKYYQTKDFKLSVEDLTFVLGKTALTATKVNGGTSEDYSPKITRSLLGLFGAQWTRQFTEDGDYTLEVSAIDNLLHPIVKGEPITFTIDATAPMPYINNVVDQALYSAPLKGVDIGVNDKNIDLGHTTLTVKKDGKIQTVSPLNQNGENASNQYDFTEDGVYSIELETTDFAQNRAKAAPVTFTVDQTNPELEISKITNGGHYQEIKDVVLTALDLTLREATLVIKRDGQQILSETLKGNVENNLIKAMKSLDFTEEGDYELILIATDRTERTTEKKMSFTIDHTAPALDFSGISEGSFLKNGTLNVNILEHNFETDNVTITATRKTDRDKDAEPYTEIKKWENAGEKASLAHFFDKDGDYVVVVEAEDKALNKAKKELHFTIDNVKPIIGISNSNENGSYYNADKAVSISVNERNFEGNNVTIEATKKVEAGDEKQAISIGDWKNTAESSSLSNLFTEDGEYEITVNAMDLAGNLGDKQTVKFTVDKTKPLLSITGVGNDDHYNVDKPVEAKVIDRNLNLNGKNLTVTRDGKPYSLVGQLGQTGTTAQNSFIFTEEGSYLVNLNLTDKAGNYQEHEPISFVIDKTNPVLKINGVEDQSFNPAEKPVSVTVDELNFATNNVELTATKDGKQLDIGEWKNTGKMSALNYDFSLDGLYTVWIKAKDKAGNGPIEAAKTFTVDKVKPAIEITGVENNQEYNVDKPVTATIKDVNLDVNKIKVTKDGANYNAGNFTIAHHQYENSVATLTHHFSAEGDYEVVVEATDKAGNSFSQQVKFTIDKTKPVITSKFKGESRVITDGEFINKIFTPEFALDEPEDSIVSVTLNDGANVKNNLPLASSEMAYHYKVLARDKAGNETTLEISFTLDTTKPELNISGILDGFFNKDMVPKITYSDKHLDPSKTSVMLNGDPFENGKKLDYEKDYVFKAVITDLANNVTTRTIVFTIDKTSPVIKFKEPISNKYFNKDLIPQLLIEDFSEYDIITQTLDGKPYKLGTPIKEEGKHVLYFEVKDKAGNIKQISVEFIIDKTAPKVVYDGVKKGGKYYNPVSVSIRLDNPLDKIKTVTLNGKVFDGEVVTEDGTEVIKTKLSDKKSYEIKVSAYDEAGNEIKSVLPFKIVEKSLIVKFYENKPFMMGSIAGVVGVIGLLGSLVFRKKKEDGAEEEV